MRGINTPDVRRRWLWHRESLLPHLLNMLLEDERCGKDSVGQSVSRDDKIRKVEEPCFHALPTIDVDSNIRLLQCSPFPRRSDSA